MTPGADEGADTDERETESDDEVPFLDPFPEEDRQPPDEAREAIQAGKDLHDRAAKTKWKPRKGKPRPKTKPEPLAQHDKAQKEAEALRERVRTVTDRELIAAAWREWRDMYGRADRLWPEEPPDNFIRDELGFKVGDHSIRETIESNPDTMQPNRQLAAAEEKTEKPIPLVRSRCVRCSRPGRGKCNQCCKEVLTFGALENIANGFASPARVGRAKPGAPLGTNPITTPGLNEDGKPDTDGVRRQPVTRELWPQDEIDWSLPDGGRRDVARTRAGAPKRAKDFTALDLAVAEGIVDGKSDHEIASETGKTPRGVGKRRKRLLAGVSDVEALIKAVRYQRDQLQSDEMRERRARAVLRELKP